MTELYDLCLLLVQRDTKLTADHLDVLQALLQVFLRRMDEITIVHVPAIAFDPENLFDVVVEAVCRGKGKHLTDLASEADAYVAERVNEMLRQRDHFPVGELPVQAGFDKLMAHVVEELAEVVQQDVAIVTILPVMLLQMACKPTNGEVVAFVRHGCAVVVDERALKHGNQGVVTEAALHDALHNAGAADMAVFAALVQVELVEAGAFELPTLQFSKGLVHVERSVGDVLLHTGFPCYSTTAAFIGTVQVLIAENSGEIVKDGTFRRLFRFSRFNSALVPRFAPFFARHTSYLKNQNPVLLLDGYI